MSPSDFVSALLPFIPPQYLGPLVDWGTFIMSVAVLIMRYWRPPAPGSRAAMVWMVVSAIAQARKWNLPAYQPGRKAVMVPATMPRHEVEQKLGMPPGSTRPGEPPVRPAPPG